MIGVAWVFSSDRRRFPWRVVLSGIALQFILAVLLLKTPVGSAFFNAMRAVVGAFLGYTEEGTRFVFGGLVETGFSIFVNVLPIIIFSGCFFSVLYHLGVLQRVVDVLSAVLTRTMRISGAESLCAAANLFVGMTEAALVVKPYLPRMTRSELFALMTLGMATVAGSVLLAYVGMLGGADYAGHLATASLLSVPAGLLIAKIMVPETGTPETTERGHAGVERTAVNVIDAAAAGALAGLRLASYVGALLIAFVAMIALLNGLLGALGELFGVQLTLQGLLGFALAPVAALMGVPWEDARQVGALLGVKTILNEFLAYQQLAELISTGAISKRAAVIASYGLCGFANFGSLAILLGGIGGLAPERRPEVAQLGLRCILAGSLATFMTGCMAGLLL
ncbi:MAG: NupC/NupG family nucleoside CNT transporter [Deltaproteobacteria bacterium]|nr:NupC/NupG family nucleoside CNT transporter [Deltaproteobacteria bacterium]